MNDIKLTDANDELNDFIEYLYNNSGSEYNMQTIVRTIDSMKEYFYGYSDRCARGSGNPNNMYYMVIKKRHNENSFAVMYYSIISKPYKLYDHANNIICPLYISNINGTDVIVFNKDI